MSWPTPGAIRLIDAMVRAEGGTEAFLRAVRCSMPTCENYAEARAIAANTIAHALWDYVTRLGVGGVPLTTAFIHFLGEGDAIRPGWAPVPKPGDPPLPNDPQGLNTHWVPNVLAVFMAEKGART